MSGAGRPEFWNHNAAYYPWLRRQLRGKRRILDAGCGEGSLVRFLASPGRTVTGVDPDEDCIRRASARAAEGTEFRCCTLEEFPGPGPFDAVIFSASLHHMDGERALDRAAALLEKGGLLLIVGLARPSAPGDWLLEGLRVLPCAVLSLLHGQKSSEELGVPVSYALPSMGEVRALIRRKFPGARLRQGLYYRWLLRWEKPQK